MKLGKGLKPDFAKNKQELQCGHCDKVTKKIGTNPYVLDEHVCPACWNGKKEYQVYHKWYAEYGAHADAVYAEA